MRARTPNQFYFYMNGTRPSGFDPAAGKTGKLDDHMFFANPDEIKPLAALPRDSLCDAVAVSYYCWNISRQPVASVDPDKNSVFLLGSCGVPFIGWTQNERYYLENYREALDTPGEWFLDSGGVLHYKPRPDEDMRSAEVVAPVTDTLLSFSSAGADQPVANITLRGLRFAHAGYLLPPEGQTSPQAACQIPAAIVADYARNVVFEDCEVETTLWGPWAGPCSATCRCRWFRGWFGEADSGLESTGWPGRVAGVWNCCEGGERTRTRSVQKRAFPREAPGNARSCSLCLPGSIALPVSNAAVEF